MPLEDRIIAEVAWIDTDALLVKETDRAARKGSVVVFQGSEQGTVVRRLGAKGEEGDDGWIDAVSPKSTQWLKS
jgi:dipeptidyl aminopeptidase